MVEAAGFVVRACNQPNPVIRIRCDTHRLTVFPYIGKPEPICVAQNWQG